METELLLKDFVSAAREAFGPALTGVYLHGSLAMGCFCPGASDVDLIVVTDSPPGHGEKLAFLRRVLDLSGQTPGGIEMSVVLRQHCERFVYPTPYELHVSPAHLARALADPAAFARRMHGADRDLAAHFTVLRQRGCGCCGRGRISARRALPYLCIGVGCGLFGQGAGELLAARRSRGTRRCKKGWRWSGRTSATGPSPTGPRAGLSI